MGSRDQNTASIFRITVRNALTPIGRCASFGPRRHIAGSCSELGDAGAAVDPAPPDVPVADADVVLFEISLALGKDGD